MTVAFLLTMIIGEMVLFGTELFRVSVILSDDNVVVKTGSVLVLILVRLIFSLIASSILRYVVKICGLVVLLNEVLLAVVVLAKELTVLVVVLLVDALVEVVSVVAVESKVSM